MIKEVFEAVVVIIMRLDTILLKMWDLQMLITQGGAPADPFAHRESLYIDNLASGSQGVGESAPPNQTANTFQELATLHPVLARDMDRAAVRIGVQLCQQIRQWCHVQEYETVMLMFVLSSDLINFMGVTFNEAKVWG